MNTDSFRKTDVALSFLIQNLYGDEDYRLIKSSHDLKEGRRYFVKMLRSIRYAIEETIKTTDSHHKQQMLETVARCQETISMSRDFGSLDQQMIAFQAELIFLLIGLMPRRWSQQKVVNTRKSWKLDDYRQIQYVHSPSQNVKLIFGAVQDGKYEALGPWDDFRKDIWREQCREDPDELISWLKRSHPDIYCDLF